MPDDQCARMGSQVCLVRWQYRAEKSQFMKFAEFAKRWTDIAAYFESKRWFVVKQPEEDQFIRIVDEILDLPTLEHNGVERIAADETLVAPDGHEAAPRIVESAREPVSISAALASSIDEGAGKDVVIFHIRSACRREFTLFVTRH